MRSIFVSHTHTDAEFARRLIADLRSHNWNAQTFRDVVGSSAFEFDKLDARIVQAIQSGSFFIPVLSPQALTSLWFEREIEIAIRSEEQGAKVNIFPALKEECILPSILGLRTPADFRTSYEAGFESLLAKLSVPLVTLTQPSLRETRNLPNVQVALGELAAGFTGVFILSPSRFEQLVAGVFESLGYKVELSKKTSDGGIDLLILGIKDPNKKPLMFECKRYARGKRLGIDPVGSISEIGPHTPDRRFLISTTYLQAPPEREKQWRTPYPIARSRWDFSLADYSALLEWLSLYPELGSEITQPIDQARKRHAELIDKKFTSNLTSNERVELTGLEQLLDEAEAPHYEDTIRKLTEVRNRLTN